MAIDLGRFHQAFFEESFEGLDVMEQALLKLDPSADNADTVNTIFRAAHSIKGGAATFNFQAVADFTHLLETLLDAVRSGKRGIDPALIDLLLKSQDVVRDLLRAAKDGGSVEDATVADIKAQLKQALTGEAPTAAAPPPATPAPPAAAKSVGFKIHFAPKPQMYRSGNDPLRIMRELAGLGAFNAALVLSETASFSSVDPEDCVMAWELELQTPVTRPGIEEVFAWVDDECDLRIEPLQAVAAQPVSSAPAAPGPSAPVPVAAPATAPVVAPEQVAAPEAAAKPAAAKAGRSESVAAEATSIRVNTDKIDQLINLVGELVITQAMLAQAARDLDPVAFERIISGLQQLERNTRNLQEAVLSTRMMPIESVFSRFPRMVRDLSGRLGKQVRLQTIGESTELDKSVIEKISDPLTHLVRNSIDHGLEPPEERQSAGKNPLGTVTLKASHQGGNIVIEVSDDGRGLNREKILAKARAQNMPMSANPSDQEVWQLIFAPGFSTAEKVTDVSGRGVGMDVVKRNILALGGQIDIWSQQGKGASITIRLPLTLAILDGMMVAVGKETFVVPLNSVTESLRPEPEQLRSVTGQGRVVRVHDEYLPLVQLYQLFRIDTEIHEPERGIIVVLEADGRKLALQVDDLVGQQQVVIKNLETNYHRVFGVSGATILGDGHVALIIDAAGLVRSTYRSAAA